MPNELTDARIRAIAERDLSQDAPTIQEARLLARALLAERHDRKIAGQELHRMLGNAARGRASAEGERDRLHAENEHLRERLAQFHEPVIGELKSMLESALARLEAKR